MARRVAKRHWNELDLVCSTGVGLEAIAPQVCRLLREIVGADAGALFWIGEAGMPAGFFHEDTNPDARDLFVNAFQDLFVGERELNVTTLVALKGMTCGHLLAPPEHYWRSNTYNLLVRASGHRHTIDLRVDCNGLPRAMVMLFRGRAEPFDDEHRALLQLSLVSLRKAFVPAAGSQYWSETGPPAYLVVDRTGERLQFSTETAQTLLQESNQVSQGVPAHGPLHTPPLFARRLCHRLQTEERPSLLLPTSSGRLRIYAEYLNPTTATDIRVLITIHHEVPDRLALVTRVLNLDLSPKQKTIMLAAATGASRTEATLSTRTSAEAMKKHLVAIYAATGVHSWQDLIQSFALKQPRRTT